jgi:hypothetical protein
MWKFFQTLFSGSSKSDSGVSLESWGASNDFKSEMPAKMQLRSEYDHLVFFQQGSDHNTANLIRKRTPDSATIIANCAAAHDGNVESYICYLFENTTESLPTLHLANRESALFATMRGSKLSPISMPSEFSSTHSGLSQVAQWGDRLFKDATIKEAFSAVESDKLVWVECEDCHVLVVTKDFHPSIAVLEKTIFHHFAQYRFRK